MVSVYKFKIYDIVNDELTTSKYFATPKFINSLQSAVILTETRMEIDEKLLDGDGKFLENFK